MKMHKNRRNIEDSPKGASPASLDARARLIGLEGGQSSNHLWFGGYKKKIKKTSYLKKNDRP